MFLVGQSIQHGGGDTHLLAKVSSMAGVMEALPGFFAEKSVPV